MDKALETIQKGGIGTRVAHATLPFDSPDSIIFGKWDSESQRRAPKRARSIRPIVLKNSNQLVEIAKLPVEQQVARIKKLQEAVKEDLPALARWCSNHIIKVATRFHSDQANLRCAVVMVAIERYRRANKRWPHALTDLAPAYLPKVPLDPFDGTPLRYRRWDDGVVIYSVGPDGKDNGGKLDKAPMKEGSNLGLRLWDVPRRRQPPEQLSKGCSHATRPDPRHCRTY